MSRIAFITNFCPHYRVRTFETLGRRHDVDYYFFSSGDDWYWLREHGTSSGRFRARRTPGFRIGASRITPLLPLQLWSGRYDAYIKCINGRVALPLTFLTARLAGRPFILWTGVWMRLQTPAHRLFYPLTRFLYRHADAVVVYGSHVARFLEGEGVRPERIFVAPHAVDNPAYNRHVPPREIQSLRSRLQLEDGAKIVLFVGRLEPDKGLDVLLRAFASAAISGSVLVLAGTGSARTCLEGVAQQLGIADRVRFAGYVAPSDTVAYYAAASILVLPSMTTARFKEPWGLVVNEAFNQGLPVVASDAVGAAAGGLVQDRVNGLVVPENDAKALASSFRQMLNDAALRDAMSRNARATIATWNNDAMVSGFERAIEYALAARERRPWRAVPQGDGKHD